MSTYLCYNSIEVVKVSVNRLFQIINILLTKKTVTAIQLSKTFEVSTRTIYRDIDTLSAAGIPVYATQGKGGGISLLDNYILDKSILSATEQEQILVALKNISAASPHTETLLQKMSGLFQKPNIDWMEVDLSRWGNKRQDTYKFDLLRRGILQKHITTFYYIDSQGKKSTKIIKPAKLIFKSKAWYLQGFCIDSQNYRTYKLYRMNNITLQPEHFTDNLAAPSIEDMLHIDTYPKIKLKFTNNIAYRIYDEFDEANISLDNQNNLIVTIQMPEDEWLYGYLLSFGASVQILEPLRIKNILASRALELFKTHTKT